MEQILSMSKDEQAQIFQEAAARSKNIKSPTIIEKDFWVCWALKQIFSIPEIMTYITFKGGTSLSKCYNIINRFSEDCDLTLNKEFLGITEDTETVSGKGRNQRDKFIKALTNAAKNKINQYIKPLLITHFKTELSKYYNDNEWRIETDPDDEQSLLFYYPAALQTNMNGYVQSIVKLEFGARGDHTPYEPKKIMPYIYPILSEILPKRPSIKVATLTVERTFWEKITLLHAEHHRKLDKGLQLRIFRHYYDIVMLDKSGITTQALKDSHLLDIVLNNKKIYFPSASANYETAKIGTLCLLPNAAFIEVLKQDYNKMFEMFFGETPKFDDIMTHIEKLEKTINTKKK
jgi:hypothetical protein